MTMQTERKRWQSYINTNNARYVFSSGNTETEDGSVIRAEPPKLPEEMRAYVWFDVKKTDYYQFWWKVRITNSNHSEHVLYSSYMQTDTKHARRWYYLHEEISRLACPKKRTFSYVVVHDPLQYQLWFLCLC